MNRISQIAMGLVFGAFLAAGANAQGEHGQGEFKMEPPKAAPLPPMPDKLPAWMDSPRYNEYFYKRGPYNFDIYNVRELALDMNGVAVGHSMAYEDLVTGKEAGLETATWNRIVRVLKNPPKNMPGEKFISPTFARYFGALEKVFDWTHVMHAQTIDVLTSTDLAQELKDKEIDAIWKFYKAKVPYTIVGLPMNMGYLDAQPYSGAFRAKYPKVNALFWGYHWLQTSVYDPLWLSRNLDEQRKQYDVVGKRYREIELYKTDRDFMPMMAETSPEFARRYPDLSNAFDNLHMLHDMVNDILSTDWMSDKQKEDQIKRAIWMVTDEAHKGEKPGDFNPNDPMHDHRFMEGQPGMGMMKMATPQLMYMPGMGWGNMSECGHCSMPLNFDPKSGAGATVSSQGWTMNVRCMLCARDMAAQYEGEAIIRGRTEDPNRPLILISDEDGNWTSNIPGVVFLEVEGPHAGCSDWSRAFTSRAAFDAYIKAQDEEDEELKKAKPLTLAEWSVKAGETPDTFQRKVGPVENPYKMGPPPPRAAVGPASFLSAPMATKPACCGGKI
ncbi:MAG: hypothetical protein WAO58_01845 [Fimbriimonadaceae bacterium]